MRITVAQARSLVRACLISESVSAEALHQKYPFVDESTVQLLKQFIWRFAADIARARRAAPKHRGDTQVSEIPSGEVRDVAQDVMFSLGAQLSDLVVHFVPDVNVKQQRREPPPPSSGVRKKTQATSARTRNYQPTAEGPTFSQWPGGQTNRPPPG